MRHVNLLWGLALVAAVFVFGCSDNPQSPVTDSSQLRPLPQSTSALQPQLMTATLNVFIYTENNQPINIHEITADWTEAGVTWNGIQGSFNPDVAASFIADIEDMKSIDITSLVNGWMEDPSSNNGILLDQVEIATPRGAFVSRESNFRDGDASAYIELCFDIPIGGELCVDVPVVMDAYVFEGDPDANFGMGDTLYTGWEATDGMEYQTVMKFSLPEPPQLASIGDFVWRDLDGMGVQDEGEPGVPDVQVRLYTCEDQFVDSTFTDSDGHYLFEGVLSGDYYLHFMLPDGYEFVDQYQGMDELLDSNVDPETGKTECITVEAGEENLSVDAGLFLVDVGCTRSKGYWKNHAGFGPQEDVLSQYLPIWLGTEDGENSVAVEDAETAVTALSYDMGVPRNGITKLLGQLMAAKLNIAAGADNLEVADLIDSADTFLAEYSYEDWDMLNKEDQQMVLHWKDTLDAYNNGYIGPGYCNDDEDHPGDMDDDDTGYEDDSGEYGG